LAGNKPWLMALDLSTPRGVVVVDGPGGTASSEVAGSSRVSRLFVAAGELMSATGINARELGLLGVGKGPGSFTGVRVAVTAAKVLASVLDIPLVAPDSLMVTAVGAGRDEEVVFACIDARRGEVYHALYRIDDGYPEVLMEPRVSPPEEAADSIRAWMEGDTGVPIGAGSGYDAYLDCWPYGLAGTGMETPQAESLAGLCRLALERGEIVDPVTLLPIYLRQSDARERYWGGRGEGAC
jgi:tRNA threonylcarbamoyladenosine biosynthesis protein TsaB